MKVSLLSRTLAVFIVGAMLWLGLFISKNVLSQALLSPHNNFNVLAEALYTCTPFERERGERMVILRLDDVQGHTWSDVSMRMIADAHERGLPLVLGVIPKGLVDDTKLVTFLSLRACNIEIAVHGFDHGRLASDNHSTTAEFGSLSYDSALERFHQALTAVEPLSLQQPVTFIPPQNLISEEAARAAHDAGLPIISSEGNRYFDYKATSWNFSTQSFFPFATIKTQCTKAFNESDLCVIMLHPQDFVHDDGSLDEIRYLEYRKLLSYLSESTISVVTFVDLLDRAVEN
jgi:hypothetical protein